jgi:2,3-bisphosphoglycerate-dependent phosphoglycerate mutase
MRVLLVRHALPEPPVPGAPGVADNERPLTGEGRQAAEALADQLAVLPIRAIYSSPYRRARETVAPIASRANLPVRILEELRERRLATSPLDRAAFVEAVTNARIDPDRRLAGGESTRDAQLRGWAALEQIRTEVDRGIAVAGTHGGLISILRWSLGAQFTVEEALAVPMPALFAVEHDGSGWRLGV